MTSQWWSWSTSILDALDGAGDGDIRGDAHPLELTAIVQLGPGGGKLDLQISGEGQPGHAAEGPAGILAHEDHLLPLPNIPVSRTIQGIKEGRDELMEAAIAYIRTGK